MGNSNTSHDHSRSGYLVNRFCDHTASFVNNQPGNMVFPTFRLGEIYLNFIEASFGMGEKIERQSVSYNSYGVLG